MSGVVNSANNVYDEKGTVLYRAVPNNSPAVNGKSDDVKKNKTTADGAEADIELSATALLNTSMMSATATAVVRAKGLRANKSVVFNPLLGSTDTHAGAATAGKDEPKLIQNSLTPEKALAQLFPPEPLQLEELGEEEGERETLASTMGTGREAGGERAWMKVAAVDHTSRLDCVHLQDHLERRCREENARPSGVVCTVREGIYTDGLRELIRQATVLCPERGLLLAELAEEMQQTTNTYDILFDGACQYAVRKAIERDMRSYLFDEKKQMESEVRRLENRVNELKAKHEGMMKRFEEQKQAEQNRHDDEVKYLKKANQQIISEIKRITALEKANAMAAAAQAAKAAQA